MAHGSGSIIDYYEVLGLEADASDEEIKKAYRSLAKAFHPDTSTHPKAKERFLAISAAYDVLSDPDSKRDYDSRLKASLYGEDFDASDDDTDGSYGFDDDGSEDSDDSEDSEDSEDSDEDDYSRMADYEFYSGEVERFLIDGVERRFENARHIVIGDKEYIIVDGDTMLHIGEVTRINHEGRERYRIGGVDYTVNNAEHLFMSGNEYVIIEGRPFRIRSI
ncbi:J domain-containing protein [Methanomicrobium mobile]|uniref:J domain-containing protein n=1 Tax=Methanomicrobium mobile TaxID=2205 RepID=UPI0005B25FD2|nr:J domain-containing protein [Methanomicrobium mobile]